ncbi:MAG: EAL domain-containing protein [Solirubrobacteraceae bacterium]
MYCAKNAGGNQVALYGPELEQAPDAGNGQPRAPRLSWSARIRTALDHDDFVLYAQPILDLATNDVCQHELLLRLPLASGEVVLPSAFLYTAERFGLICELDRWVLAHALTYAAAHRGRTVAINLAADTVCDPQLTSFITTEIARTGADPHDLIFEVTETAAISNIAAANRSLTQLNALGARTALDDFGAGFGSFHHLKQLPLDILKIDGEFIRNLTASRRDRTIVRSMVDLAHGLGQLATAEHIEDQPTLDLVRDLGVDLAQGHFIGSAQPTLPPRAHTAPQPCETVAPAL